MSIPQFGMTMRLRGLVLALALLLSGPVVAQVSRPTVLHGCQIQLGDVTLEIPDNGTVTPRAGDLVIAFIGYGDHVSRPTEIMAIDTPAWAARGWTLITNTARVGTFNLRVAAYWTIANSSPSADDTVLTFSQVFQHNSGGCLVSYDAGTFNATNPIAQFDVASAATLAGGTALTGTFDRTPASGSQLLFFGKTFGEPLWGFSDPSPGWTKLELPGPTEEGGNQTSYTAGALATNGNGYGSDFGNTSPAHDQNGGVTIVALEIQAASGGGTPPPPPPIPPSGGTGGGGGGGGGATLLELILLGAALCSTRGKLAWRLS
jgi:hypothetical protein